MSQSGRNSDPIVVGIIRNAYQSNCNVIQVHNVGLCVTHPTKVKIFVKLGLNCSSMHFSTCVLFYKGFKFSLIYSTGQFFFSSQDFDPTTVEQALCNCIFTKVFFCFGWSSRFCHVWSSPFHCPWKNHAVWKATDEHQTQICSARVIMLLMPLHHTDHWKCNTNKDLSCPGQYAFALYRWLKV